MITSVRSLNLSRIFKIKQESVHDPTDNLGDIDFLFRIMISGSEINVLPFSHYRDLNANLDSLICFQQLHRKGIRGEVF